MTRARKILAAALSAGVLMAGSVPAQADSPSNGFCSFVPRICEALCIKGGVPTRCQNN